MHMYSLLFNEESKLCTCIAFVQQELIKAVHVYSLLFNEESKLCTCIAFYSMRNRSCAHV